MKKTIKFKKIVIGLMVSLMMLTNVVEPSLYKVFANESVPTATPSAEPSATPSASASAEPSATPSASASAEPSATPSASASVEPSATPSASASTEPDEELEEDLDDLETGENSISLFAAGSTVLGGDADKPIIRLSKGHVGVTWDIDSSAACLVTKHGWDLEPGPNGGVAIVGLSEAAKSELLRLSCYDSGNIGKAALYVEFISRVPSSPGSAGGNGDYQNPNYVGKKITKIGENPTGYSVRQLTQAYGDIYGTVYNDYSLPRDDLDTYFSVSLKKEKIIIPRALVEINFNDFNDRSSVNGAKDPYFKKVVFSGDYGDDVFTTTKIKGQAPLSGMHFDGYTYLNWGASPVQYTPLAMDNVDGNWFIPPSVTEYDIYGVDGKLYFMNPEKITSIPGSSGIGGMGVSINTNIYLGAYSDKSFSAPMKKNLTDFETMVRTGGGSGKVYYASEYTYEVDGARIYTANGYGDEQINAAFANSVINHIATKTGHTHTGFKFSVKNFSTGLWEPFTSDGLNAELDLARDNAQILARLNRVYGNRTIKIEPIFTKNNYTIRFLDVDGNLLQESSQLYDLKIVNIPFSAPAILGHTFDGWLSTRDSRKISTAANAENQKVLDRNEDFKATYKANVHNVTFIAHDDTTISTKPGTYGTVIPSETVPERLNYNVVGWKQTLPAGQSYTPGVSTMPDNAVTFKAEYTLKDIRVEWYNGQVNDGLLRMKESDIKALDTITHPNPNLVTSKPATSTIVGWKDFETNKIISAGVPITMTDTGIDSKLELIPLFADAANGDKVWINAKNYAINNVEAKDQSDATVTALSNANASQNIGGTVSAAPITINVDDLNSLIAAPEKGGQFNVRLTATNTTSGEAVERTIIVTVRGKNTEITDPDAKGEALFITGNYFLLENDAALVLTQDEAITKGSVLSKMLLSNANADSITVDAAQLDAIKNTTKMGGTYPLQFTARKNQDGKDYVIRLTLQVFVKGFNTDTGNVDPSGERIIISAKNVILSNAEAKAITGSDLITRSSAQAVLLKATTAVTNISADPSGVSKIQNVPESGGTYSLTLTANQTVGSTALYADVTINVIVLGSNTSTGDPSANGDRLAISANNFSVENADASTLTSDQSVTKSGAKAFLIDARENVSSDAIIANNAQLGVIKAAKTIGGIYDLEFDVTHIGADGYTYAGKVPVKVFVKGLNTDVTDPDADGESIGISANNVILTHDEAKAITDSILKNRSNVTAMLLKSGSPLKDAEITVDAGDVAKVKNVGITGGTFKVKFTATRGVYTITSDIQVIVIGNNTEPGNPDLDGERAVIKAEYFVLENNEAAGLNSADAVIKANATAFMLNSRDVISANKITANADELKLIKAATTTGGYYDLTFTVSNEVGGHTFTAQKTVKVFVKGLNTVVTDPDSDGESITLTAKNIVVTNEEGKGLTGVGALTRSKAESYLVKSTIKGTNLVANATDLDLINKTQDAGGVYNLRISSSIEYNGKTYTTEVPIKVIVLGTNTNAGSEDPTGERIIINAHYFVLENADAKSLSATSAKTKSAVSSYMMNSHEVVSNIAVDQNMLNAIKAAPSIGGAYDLTFTATKGTHTVSQTIKVFVKGTNVITDGPRPAPDGETLVIVAKDIVLDYGEAQTFDVNAAVVKGDVDAYFVKAGRKIDPAAIMANKEDLGKINSVSILGDVFELTFSVTDAESGETFTVNITVNVTVTGNNIAATDPDEFGESIRIHAKTIVLTNDEAKAFTVDKAKTQADAKAALVESKVLLPSANILVNTAQLELIRNTTDAGGVYDLIFTAKADANGKTYTISKPVKVIVAGSNTEIGPPGSDGDMLMIEAYDFVLEQSELGSLTDVMAIAKARAHGQMVDSTYPADSYTVDAIQFQAIKDATEAGGIFPLKITGKYTRTTGAGAPEEYSATIEIEVTVKGKNTGGGDPDPENEYIIINAKYFTIENNEASTLDLATSLMKSQATSKMAKSGAVVTDIKVDALQLFSINSAGLNGGVFPLKVTAKHIQKGNTYTVTQEILVTVKGTQTVIDGPKGPNNDILVFTAHNIVLENAVAVGFTDTDAYTLSGARAFMQVSTVNVSTFSVVDVAEITAIQNAGVRGGTFPLTLRASYTDGTTSWQADVTVEVLVKGTTTGGTDPDDIGESIFITAENFRIANANAATLTDSNAKTLSQVRSWMAISGANVTDITVNQTQLNAIKAVSASGGVYPLTFTARMTQNSRSYVITQTIQVVVEGNNTVVVGPDDNGQHLVLRAWNFALDHADALVLDNDNAILSARAYAYILETGQAVPNILPNATELGAINVAPTSGGLLPLTFSVTNAGVTANAPVSVTVRGTGTGGTDPDDTGESIAITAKSFAVTIEEAQALTNQEALNKSSARSWLVTSTDPVTNLLVNGPQLAAIKGVSSAGGIYPLRINASHTKNGKNYATSITVNVIVSGSGTVVDGPNADGELLTLTAQGFTIDQVDAAGLQADNARTLAKAIAKVIPTGTSLLPEVDATELAIIQGAPVAGGIYNLTFKSTHTGGLEVSKTVPVVVKGTNTDGTDPDEFNESISITANYFSLSNDEAKGLTEAISKTKSNVQSKLMQSGIVVTDIKANQAQLNTIKAVSAAGGVFPLAFTAKQLHNGKTYTITLEIKVFVEGTNTVIIPDDNGNHLVLRAWNFAIENAEANGLDDAKAITKSRAEAYVMETGEVVTGIAVKQAELTTIKGAPAGGGVYPLTFDVTNAGATASIPVDVTVKGTNTGGTDPDDTGESIIITAKYFILENAEASGLTEAISKTKSNVQASMQISGANVTNIKVDATELAAIKAVSATGGTYPLKFTATHLQNGKTYTTDVMIQVIVKGSHVDVGGPDDDGNNLALRAWNFAIDYADLSGLDNGLALTKSRAEAHVVETGTPVSGIAVDATQLDTIKNSSSTGGNYPLEFVVTNKNATARVTINVTVNGTGSGGTDPDDTGESIIISANSFQLTVQEARALTNQNVITKSNVTSKLVASNSAVTDFTVDATQLAAIKATADVGGVFPIKITATKIHKGKTYTITHQVFAIVTGANTEVDGPNVDNEFLLLSATGFTLTNAQAGVLTGTEAVMFGHATSSLVPTGTSVTPVAKATDIEAINNVTEAGGIFTLEYQSNANGLTVKKKVTVVVLGTNTGGGDPDPGTGDRAIITANFFTIPNADAAGLTENSAKTLSQVRSWMDLSTTVITDIKANEEQLNKIKAVSTTGGIFPLTFTATHRENKVDYTASVTINVFVEGTNVDTEDDGNGNTLVLVANNFGIEWADRSMTAPAAITKGNAQAWIVETGSSIPTITVDAGHLTDIAATASTGSLFNPLKYSVTSGTGTAEVTANVTVRGTTTGGGDPDDTGESIVIQAAPFKITVDQAKALTLDEIITYSAAHSELVSDRTVVNTYRLDQGQFDAIKNTPNVGGVYPLTITATTTKNGKLYEASKTVNVLVTGKGTDIDGPNTDGEFLTLSARGFVLTLDEANHLNDATAISKGTAKASVIPTGTTITPTVDATQLAAIVDATEAGGIYELTYSATHTGPLNTNVKVTVVVLGNNTGGGDPDPGTGDMITITAESFSLTNMNAKTLTEEIAKTQSRVQSKMALSGLDADTITANVDQLKKINAVTAAGGVFPLTYTAKKIQDGVNFEISHTVNVYVEGDNTDIGGPDTGETLALSAHGFTIDYADLGTLTEATAKAKAKAGARVLPTGLSNPTNVDAMQLDSIKTSASAGGTYPLKFTSTLRSINVEVTVLVTVLGTNTGGTDPDPKGESIIIEALPIILENSAAATFTEEVAKTQSRVRSNLVVSRVDVPSDQIKINDSNEIQAIKNAGTVGGTYPLTFTASIEYAGETYTINKTINVFVKGTGTDIDGPTEDGSMLVLSARGFTIDHADLASLNTSNEVITRGHASSQLVPNGLVVTPTFNTTQRNAIINSPATGGVYPLTYNATYTDTAGTYNASVTVQVIVLGSNTGGTDPDENGESIIITANSFVQTNVQAQGIDEGIAITESNVRSFMLSNNAPADTITANASQLAAIKAVSAQGGIFDLTFTAKKTVGSKTFTIDHTVKVFVTGTNTDVGPDLGADRLAITASNFIVANADAARLTDALVVTKSQAKTYLLSDLTPADTVVANATQLALIQAAGPQGGEFPLRLTATRLAPDGNTYTVSVTVQVLVLGTTTGGSEPDDLNESIIIKANYFALTNDEAKALTEDQAKTKSSVSSYMLNSRETVTNIKATKTQLDAIKATTTAGGVYDLAFVATHTAKNGRTYTIDKTVKVFVEGSNVDIVGPIVPTGKTIAIVANNATIEHADAATYTSAIGVAAAQASAYVVEDSMPVSGGVSISSTQIDEVRATSSQGNIYAIDYIATHVTQGITINGQATRSLVVKGTAIDATDPDDLGEMLIVKASSFTVDYADASLLTEGDVLTKSNAFATMLLSGQNVTNIKASASHLNAVRAATSAGGIFPMLLSATHTQNGRTYTLTKLIYVTVIGTNVDITTPDADGDMMAFVVYDYTLTYAQAQALTEQDGITASNARALMLTSGELVTNFAANSTDIQAINATGEDGGMFALKITATHTTFLGKTHTSTLSANVKVLPKPITPPATPDTGTGSGGSGSGGRTCQDDGFPEDYVWNDEVQACIPGYIGENTTTGGKTYRPKPTPTATVKPDSKEDSTTKDDKNTDKPVITENPSNTGRENTRSTVAIVNVITTLLTVLVGIVYLMMKRSKEVVEDGVSRNYIRKVVYKVLLSLLAVISVIVLILTQNFGGVFTLIDQWTILMVILALISLVLFSIGSKWHQES